MLSESFQTEHFIRSVQFYRGSYQFRIFGEVLWNKSLSSSFSISGLEVLGDPISPVKHLSLKDCSETNEQQTKMLECIVQEVLCTLGCF